MKPAPDTSDPAPDMLRKQLILAQVQLMELEDLRDSLQTKLAATRAQIDQSRQLTDSALLAQGQSESDRREMEEECIKLRASLRQARDVEVGLTSLNTLAQTTIAQRDQTLRDRQADLATLRTRIEQLEAELLAMKTSRSWRYTAFLRFVERLLRLGGRPK